MEQVRWLWGLKHVPTYNIAPNPVSLTRSKLPLLENEMYVCAEKTDGERQLLLLTRDPMNPANPLAVFIGRNLCMFKAQMHGPACLFNGTLLDGELVADKNHCLMKYLVFDVVAFAGYNTTQINYVRRLELASDLLLDDSEINEIFWFVKSATTQVSDEDTFIGHPQPPVTDVGYIKVYEGIYFLPFKADALAVAGKLVSFGSPPLILRTKRCLFFKDMATLHRQRSNLSHLSDGYIFTPVNVAVQTNKHEFILKWKYHPTIDCEVKIESGDTFSLYCRNAVPLSATLPTSYSFLVVDASIETLCTKSSYPTIIEFKVTVDEPKHLFTLTAMRLRQDKVCGNDSKTVMGILREIQDAISIEELIKLSQEKK